MCVLALEKNSHIPCVWRLTSPVSGDCILTSAHGRHPQTAGESPGLSPARMHLTKNGLRGFRNSALGVVMMLRGCANKARCVQIKIRTPGLLGTGPGIKPALTPGPVGSAPRGNQPAAAGIRSPGGTPARWAAPPLLHIQFSQAEIEQTARFPGWIPPHTLGWNTPHASHHHGATAAPAKTLAMIQNQNKRKIYLFFS